MDLSFYGLSGNVRFQDSQEVNEKSSLVRKWAEGEVLTALINRNVDQPDLVGVKCQQLQGSLKGKWCVLKYRVLSQFHLAKRRSLNLELQEGVRSVPKAVPWSQSPPQIQGWGKGWQWLPSAHRASVPNQEAERKYYSWHDVSKGKEDLATPA